jgi:hypothetical protein
MGSPVPVFIPDWQNPNAAEMFPVEIDFSSIRATEFASIVQVTTGYHVPGAIAGRDETADRPGEGGIAEYAGVIGRIDPIEAARLHKPAAIILWI